MINAQLEFVVMNFCPPLNEVKHLSSRFNLEFFIKIFLFSFNDIY
jgi:hypothetical protein